MRLCLRFALFLMIGDLATCALSAPRAPQEATDYASHFNHGQELFKQMRFHEATAEFREAAQINPQYLPAQQALVVAYVMTENLALAWKQVRLLHQSNVDLPDQLLQEMLKILPEAEAAKQLEDIERKLAVAQQAAVEHVDSPALQAALGTALSKAGDYRAAQEAAERALQLDPVQPEAHLLLGNMLSGEPPNSEQAIPHLKMYLQNVPRTTDTAKELAQTYSRLASIYTRTGREAQSLATLEEGLKTAPENDVMLNNAAWAYATAQDASLRNPPKALDYARKAVVLSKGEKANFLDTLAEALYANSLFDEAVTTEKKALALEPRSPFFPNQLKKFQAARPAKAPTP